MLFDGLNEVPRAHRQRFADELVRWMAAYPEHPIILTGRTQDEFWRRLRERVDEALVIQPITPTQIVTYLRAQLGDERGQALYDRLDDRLRELAQRPLLLWMMKEAGAAGESLPGNRGELYARFVSRLLRRDTDHGLDRDIPERIKLSAAARLGYGLHRRYALACSRVEAVEIVDASLDPSGTEKVLESLARHGLLMGEGEYRFPHQTLQEHFAATALQTRIEAALQRPALVRWVTELRERVLPRPDDLDTLAREDWWTEPLIQLAGLVKDPAWLARRVARVNPWLAWWCVLEGRAVDEATRAAIEQRSIKLLRSADLRDRRRAVQALAQMGSDRAADFLFQAAADRVPEIAGLAAQALMQQGEAMRQRALTLAQRPQDPLHQAGLACLAALLGQPMVYVPPGPFTMGSDPQVDPDAFPAEQPQHTLELPGYWIGRYMVTVAQFRAFVESARYSPSGAPDMRKPDDHPIANVTWHDALAYCGWLTARTGLKVALPSEAEWEKAGRGTDARLYPWGNQRPNEDLCNSSMAVGQTTPVGRYSLQGDSPYGCADMAGNVWEWTRSLWGEEWKNPGYGYPYDPEDGREDEEAGDKVYRVVRGGSWYINQRFARCACRDHDLPDGRGGLGFRVMVGSPISSGG
jgi:formylglycine-generating enzyme required for sulfatase activity